MNPCQNHQKFDRDVKGQMYDDTTMCVKYGTCNILYYLILFKSKKKLRDGKESAQTDLTDRQTK